MTAHTKHVRIPQGEVGKGRSLLQEKKMRDARNKKEVTGKQLEMPRTRPRRYSALMEAYMFWTSQNDPIKPIEPSAIPNIMDAPSM